MFFIVMLFLVMLMFSGGGYYGHQRGYYLGRRMAGSGSAGLSSSSDSFS